MAVPESAPRWRSVFPLPLARPPRVGSTSKRSTTSGTLSSAESNFGLRSLRRRRRRPTTRFSGPRLALLAPAAERCVRSTNSMRASWTMLLAAGPLALWGAWALWVSVPHGQWITAVLGGVALVTAGGLLLLKVWARPLAYLFAAGLVLGWAYAVSQAISRGWPY